MSLDYIDIYWRFFFYYLFEWHHNHSLKTQELFLGEHSEKFIKNNQGNLVLL